MTSELLSQKSPGSVARLVLSDGPGLAVSQLWSRGTEDLLQTDPESSSVLESVSAYLNIITLAGR